MVLALFFLQHAFAGQPLPDGVDLEDIDGYARRAERLLDGPGGCWVVEGYATWAHRGPEGMADGEGGFEARLKSGRWEGLAGGFEPLVGRGSRRVDALGALDRWLERLTGPVETLSVEWDADRGAVRMERHAGLEDGGDDAVATTWFADEDAVEMDVRFPRHRLGPGQVLVGAGYTVTTAEVDGRTFPAEELVVYRIRERGRVIRAHQTVRYESWTPCR